MVEHFDQQIILAGHFRSLPSCINRLLHLESGKVQHHGQFDNGQAPKITSASEVSPELINLLKRPVTASYSTVLKFDQIKIEYKKKTIIECLDWTVKRGDKWVVRGPNGSGKSTLISLTYGDHPQAYSNKITLFDRTRGSGESIWDIKQEIGFTSPELHSYFNYNHPAIDVVLSGLTDTFFVQDRKPEWNELASELFDYFGLKGQMQKPFLTLSTGTQRLLFFMRALIKVPSVLLLDEPYQGLDQETISRCNELLKNILSDEHTLIFISHFPDEVPEVVDKRLSLEVK
jgi:molybdate transport system ATP-binding protein